MEVAAMTAGPVKNLTAIENVATDLPQFIIFGCKAMNKPTKYYQQLINYNFNVFEKDISNYNYLPRLNMAMPRPASDKIEIEPFTIDGILIFHLHRKRTLT